MRSGYLQNIFKNDEDRRVAYILFRIIIALLVTYLIVIGSGAYWGDRKVIITALIGSLSLIVPLAFLVCGYLRVSGLFVVLIVLITATVIATIGQGIHDIGVTAYPVIIVIASLLMQRRDFLLLSLLTLTAMGWLVFGEAFGLFVSKTYETPRGIDFIVVAVIMFVAIMAVDSLAENMRKNLRQAQQEIARRKILEEQLRHQSIHDSLTGIYNRAFFEEELARMERGREFPVSIIVADVDKLKYLNDMQGHARGDELLRNATAILCSVFRAGDVLARIGGDEFAILLPDTDSATTKQMLSRVQSKLAEHNAVHADLPVQLSLGASTAEQSKLMEAFIIADQRMYADKAMHKSKDN